MKNLILIIIISLFSFNCEKDNIELTQEELLVGRWVTPFDNTGSDDLTVYDFFLDGSYELGVIRDNYYYYVRQGSYTVEGDLITYSNNRSDVFLIEGEILYLDNTTFTRK